MAELGGSIHTVRPFLDPELDKLGIVPIQSTGDMVVYLHQPYRDILFLLTLSTDTRSRTLVGSYRVEPLGVPSSVGLVEPFREPRAGLMRRRRTWPIADISRLAPRIAQSAAVGLADLRNRFDGPATFAGELDTTFLADDWVELAEAVAYMWFIAGDATKAAEQLGELAGRADVTAMFAERAEQMASMMISDPEEARRHVGTIASTPGPRTQTGAVRSGSNADVGRRWRAVMTGGGGRRR
jgi:hypothetical protein